MLQIFAGDVAGKNFGRNAEFPYFTRNQVAVLTAGVKYGYLRQTGYFFVLF